MTRPYVLDSMAGGARFSFAMNGFGRQAIGERPVSDDPGRRKLWLAGKD